MKEGLIKPCARFGREYLALDAGDGCEGSTRWLSPVYVCLRGVCVSNQDVWV